MDIHYLEGSADRPAVCADVKKSCEPTEIEFHERFVAIRNLVSSVEKSIRKEGFQKNTFLAGSKTGCKGNLKS